MQSFTIRDLRERPGELSREVEKGNLTLVTRHGHPLFVGVPFTDSMLRHGVNTALAETLFKSGGLSLGKAAAFANMSIAEFAEYLSQLGIPVVDYPAEELEEEPRIFEST